MEERVDEEGEKKQEETVEGKGKEMRGEKGRSK